jgi:hypothetical protein
MLPSEFKEEEDFIAKSTVNESVKIVENRFLDYAIVVALGLRFAKPFEKWNAYKLGIIDAKGDIVRNPRTKEEKAALTPLDNIIRRIKKLIPMRLWYLLGVAYIFKGFMFKENKELISEEDIREQEDKDLALEMARMRVSGIIKENSKFSEEEFWNHYVNREERE